MFVSRKNHATYNLNLYHGLRIVPSDNEDVDSAILVCFFLSVNSGPREATLFEGTLAECEAKHSEIFAAMQAGKTILELDTGTSEESETESEQEEAEPENASEEKPTARKGRSRATAGSNK